MANLSIKLTNSFLLNCLGTNSFTDLEILAGEESLKACLTASSFLAILIFLVSVDILGNKNEFTVQIATMNMIHVRNFIEFDIYLF